jgi:hypothetical protein
MPPLIVDSQPTHDNQQSDLIALLIAGLSIIPNSPPIDGSVAWQNLEIGCTYMGQVTGFGSDGSPPRRFTVTDISRFPDGGAMIWTEHPAWAWGVGGNCESAVGPRNRFWAADETQI